MTACQTAGKSYVLNWDRVNAAVDHQQQREQAIKYLANSLNNKRNIDGSEKVFTEREGLTIAERIGEVELQVIGHVAIGIQLTNQGEFEAAEQSYERARKLIEKADMADYLLEIHILSAMGRLKERSGYPVQALAFHKKSLEISQRQHGELQGTASLIYFDIGRASFLAGNYLNALKNCTRAETILSAMNNVSRSFRKRIQGCIVDSEKKLAEKEKPTTTILHIKANLRL